MLVNSTGGAEPSPKHSSTSSGRRSAASTGGGPIGGLYISAPGKIILVILLCNNK